MIREIFVLGKQSDCAKSVSSRKLLNVANLRDFTDTEGLGALVTKRSFVSILSCFELLFFLKNVTGFNFCSRKSSCRC